MKRIVMIVLCLMLLGAAAMSVSATGTAHMNISSSAGTVYRGDTFTLTVSLNNDQPVSNGGIVLSYDSSALELVGGSCNVSGAILAEVSAANGGGVFMMQTDTVVSGTIFTINMRVKSDAAFGTFTISGTPSLSIPCTIGGTSVTVACNHNYENCTKVNEDTHVSTCSVCGDEKTEEHGWNEGTVDKAATCKEEGSKTLTCTGCGTTKTETIPVTDAHTYGDWSKADDSNHTHKCSVCEKVETVSHTWNGGRVTKEATCQETGTRVRTCTGCNATKTETISLSGHTYGAWTKVNDKTHTRTCSVCSKKDTADHSYSQEWEHDESGHFHTCEDCGSTKDQAAHVPGLEATETTNQVCTVCDRVLKVMTSHEHQFSTEWSADETGHWYACNACDEKDSFAAHEYDSDCDADCNICLMERTAPHDPSADWSADEIGHWHPCEDCGAKAGFEAHVPGPEATADTAQQCTVCHFEIAPMLDHVHKYGDGQTLHWHECACGQQYKTHPDTCDLCEQKREFSPWWLVCIAEALAFGGVIAYLILKDRKKQEY